METTWWINTLVAKNKSSLKLPLKNFSLQYFVVCDVTFSWLIISLQHVQITTILVVKSYHYFYVLFSLLPYQRTWICRLPTTIIKQKSSTFGILVLLCYLLFKIKQNTVHEINECRYVQISKRWFHRQSSLVPARKIHYTKFNWLSSSYFILKMKWYRCHLLQNFHF